MKYLLNSNITNYANHYTIYTSKNTQISLVYHTKINNDEVGKVIEPCNRKKAVIHVEYTGTLGKRSSIPM